MGTLATFAVLASEGGPGIGEPFLPLWLWTWVIFGLVFLVLRKFAWKPLSAQLEAREKRIQETVDKADEVKSEAEALLDKHRELMDRAKADAQEIINEGREAAERLRKQEHLAALAEIDADKERAKREIDLSARKALDEIRQQAVDLTIVAASRVLARSLDDADHRRLTSEVIEELGPVGEG